MDRYMLDTNIFNHILDQEIAIDWLPQLRYYITGLQRDEIDATTDTEHRIRLQKIFWSIEHEKVIAEGAIFDISRFDEAKFSDEIKDREWLRFLDCIKKKRNNSIDVIIAMTAKENKFILVTDDDDLKRACVIYRVKTIGLQELLALGSPG